MIPWKQLQSQHLQSLASQQECKQSAGVTQPMSAILGRHRLHWQNHGQGRMAVQQGVSSWKVWQRVLPWGVRGRASGTGLSPADWDKARRPTGSGIEAMLSRLLSPKALTPKTMHLPHQVKVALRKRGAREGLVIPSH